MPRLLLAPCLLLIAATHLPAQSPATSNFDVDSIKPNLNPDVRLRIENLPGGRLTATAATLQALVRYAFGVHESQVSSSLKWTASDRFDIVAKAAEHPGILPIERVRPMLQSLLANRFQLKIHKESKEMSVYVLTVGPNGHKLKPRTGEPEPTRPTGRGQAILRTSTTSGLAQALTSTSGRFVVNETNLDGLYDISLEFTPEVALFAAPSDPQGASVFEAVQEQLGLKLVPRRSPVEMIVIDQAEKPAAN